MDSTSAGLLRRLQSSEKQKKEIAWERFVELYAPLIFHWAKKHGLATADASELVQDVLAILVTKTGRFFSTTQKQTIQGLVANDNSK